MTDGIEAALLPCPFCGGGFEADLSGTIPLWRHKGAIGCPLRYYLIEQADADDMARWNRRHPPASREEGLREAAKAITDLAEEWKRHDGTLPRIDGEWPAYMAKVVLRLIPTKPEAKEPTAPEPPTGEEELAWEAYVAKFDDSSYGKPTSTDFWPWLKHRRALQSKKPE